MDRLSAIVVVLLICYVFKDWLPLPLFRLPGDFEIRTERLVLLVPLVSCLLVSLVVNLVFSLANFLVGAK